jgi:hypothetical protein
MRRQLRPADALLSVGSALATAPAFFALLAMLDSSD